MPESQADVDALLAEVSALADEAIADIVGEDVAAQPADATPEPEPTPAVAEPVNRASPTPRPSVQAKRPAPPAAASNGRTKEDPTRILHLEVPVIVRLAERTMPLLEIVSFTTGAIIEFDKPADATLDLMINNKCIGQGEAVKVGENFGLRVTTIGSVPDRIKALGGQ